jgi:DNA relaxase NicK
LRPVARRVAKRHRLAFPRIEDELNARAGRTQYVGSAKSNYRVRIYEKGWQVHNKLAAVIKKYHGVELQDQFIVNESTGELIRPEDWVREEIQIRPPKEEARRLVATLSAEECWGVSPWTRELAEETMALRLEKVVMRTRKIGRDEQALRWMCRQYALPLLRLHDKEGSGEATWNVLDAFIRDGRVGITP